MEEQQTELDSMDTTDGPQVLSLDADKGIPTASGGEKRREDAGQTAARAPTAAAAMTPEKADYPTGAADKGKLPVCTPAKEDSYRSAMTWVSQPFGHLQDKLQANRSLNKILAARDKAAELAAKVVRLNKRPHEHTPSKLATTVADEIHSEHAADTETDSIALDTELANLAAADVMEESYSNDPELSPVLQKFMQKFIDVLTVHSVRTQASIAALAQNQKQVSANVLQMRKDIHVFQNTIDQKLDAQSEIINSTMEAVAETSTELFSRMAETERTVQTVQADMDKQQQQADSTKRRDIHQRKAQQQLLDAIDREQKAAIKQEIQLVVTDGYQGGAEAFGRLRDKQILDLLQIPAGIKSKVLKRDKPWTPAPARATTSNAVDTRATVQQIEESPWKPGDACRRVTVEIDDTAFIKNLVGTKAARLAFKTRSGGLLVYEKLTDYEDENRRWLQRFAMGKLHDNIGVKAGWRRGYVTWRVPAKNNFAVMTKLDVPENVTVDELREIVSEIESGVTVRAGNQDGEDEEMEA